MKNLKVLSLPTNDKKIYRQILAFMNFILNITPQELDVLAEIIKMNNEYESLPSLKRAKFILSTDMRKEMYSSLNIKEKQFNGIIARLKAKSFLSNPILDKDGILNEELFFKYSDEGFKIEVNLIPTLIPQKQEPFNQEDSNTLTRDTLPEQFKDDTQELKLAKDASKEAPIETDEINFTLNEPTRENY